MVHTHNYLKELLRVFLLVTPLFLTGCAAAAGSIGGAALMYVASLNNLGSSYLKFEDDKQNKSCQVQQNPLNDPNVIITLGPYPQNDIQSNSPNP